MSDLILEKSSCIHFYIKLTVKPMGGYFVGSCGLNPTVLSLIYIFQGRGFDDKLHVPVLKLTNVSHLIKKLVVVIVN